MDGQAWIEVANIHLITSDDEQIIIDLSDIDDTPVDGADVPISANWAYDHEGSPTPHPIECNGDKVVCDNNEVVYNV